MTPLHFAASVGTPEGVQTLLDVGPVDVHRRCSHCMDAITYAAIRGRDDAMRVLLRGGARPDGGAALGRGVLSLLNLISGLAEGRADRGRQLLTPAAAAACCEVLLCAGVSPTGEAGPDVRPPLICAAERGIVPMVSVLLAFDSPIPEPPPGGAGLRGGDAGEAAEAAGGQRGGAAAGGSSSRRCGRCGTFLEVTAK